jgi:hypothetical protein
MTTGVKMRRLWEDVDEAIELVERARRAEHDPELRCEFEAASDGSMSFEQWIRTLPLLERIRAIGGESAAENLGRIFTAADMEVEARDFLIDAHNATPYVASFYGYDVRHDIAEVLRDHPFIDRKSGARRTTSRKGKAKSKRSGHHVIVIAAPGGALTEQETALDRKRALLARIRWDYHEDRVELTCGARHSWISELDTGSVENAGAAQPRCPRCDGFYSAYRRVAREHDRIAMIKWAHETRTSPPWLILAMRRASANPHVAALAEAARRANIIVAIADRYSSAYRTPGMRILTLPIASQRLIPAATTMRPNRTIFGEFALSASEGGIDG